VLRECFSFNRYVIKTELKKDFGIPKKTVDISKFLPVAGAGTGPAPELHSIGSVVL
jgi:hypothetical protein